MSRFLTLCLAALLSIATSLPWDGPQQSLSATNTANWSPAPTNDQTNKEDLRLRLRNIYPVALCGWINGDGGVGAYCSADSSCAWNTDIGRVGCCATENNACTFYTDCTTAVTLPAEGVVGSKYTCVSGSTCYQNTYPGGYLQYGCGTIEGYSGTFVATSYSGENYAEPNPLQIVYVADSAAIPAVTTSDSIETAAPTSSSLAAATSSAQSVAGASDTESSPAAASSTTSSPSSSAQASLFSSQTDSNPSTATNTILPPSLPSVTSSSSHSTPIGAIIGGVIGGLAVISLILACCFIGRRRNWFTTSPPSHHPQPPHEIVYNNDIPPRYQPPQPYMPAETKAELPVSGSYGGQDAYGRVRGVSMLESEMSFGRSEVSAATSPRIDDGSEGMRSRVASPVLVDEGFMRARMSGGHGRGPFYEVQ